jgi:hypothetical protein
MRLLGFEVRWAGQVGRVLVPKGSLGGVVDDLDLGAALQREAADAPWYAVLLIHASLWMLWLSPLLFRFRLRTLGSLPPAEQEALVEALLKHRVYEVRMVATYMKITMCTWALGDERVMERLGAYTSPVRRPLPEALAASVPAPVPAGVGGGS